MFKINAVLDQDQTLSKLQHRVNAMALVNEFWQSAAPKLLSEQSVAHQLQDGMLTVLANNAAVASKIKLTQASLLKALKNSHESYAEFSLCKVTAISVKVQVKSTPRPRVLRTIKLSATGAQHLNALATQMGDSPLSTILKKLADKQS